jgi:murein DD-endopeptidase MepM/ murein hydrolase activator NlpD
MARKIITPGIIIVTLVVFIGLLLASILLIVWDNEIWVPPAAEGSSYGDGGPEDQESVLGSPTQFIAKPVQSPTPDVPHPLPALREETEQYTVQPRDSLHQIAQRYFVNVEAILDANKINQPDFLEVGQVLTIPAPKPEGTGPGFKIIPDSELIYGPASGDFSLAEFVHQKGGYLSGYKEEVGDRKMSGVKIVERIAQEFSVNPRLLLAVLEYQSGWVTNANPDPSTLDYPMGVAIEWRQGLYNQLAWAADNLNRGYYMWRVNGLATWILAGGTILYIDPSINAGTAGVQHLFAQLFEWDDWELAVNVSGLFSTYNDFFGYPFQYSVEPILPAALEQPQMQLPFERGETWSYTGGPHGGWGSGSAWAAIDFAPPGEALGCVESEEWVVAVADGLILRAVEGAVVQDLDSDGLQGTGWTVLYMHVDSQERVKSGTFLRAGDPIGHPSCEGGVSSGTHLHLARRYNGEWIPADQDVPFSLDGWISQGLGREYDGYLIRNGQQVEAWEGRDSVNAIQR